MAHSALQRAKCQPQRNKPLTFQQDAHSAHDAADAACSHALHGAHTMRAARRRRRHLRELAVDSGIIRAAAHRPKDRLVLRRAASGARRPSRGARLWRRPERPACRLADGVLAREADGVLRSRARAPLSFLGNGRRY